MTILIVTRSDDTCSAPAVIAALEARGGRAVRFDTDLFPTEIQLSVEHRSTGDRRVLVSASGELDLATVTAVWNRRFHVGAALPTDMDAQLRRASRLESRTTAQGLLATLPVFQLDPPLRVQEARNKLRQLVIAREVGLETPATLVSNDPARVRSFHADCPLGIVAKLQSSFAIFEEGKERVVFTTPLDESDLDELESLRYAPMTFQENIPKARELRVTGVGPRMFVGSIDSGAFARSRDDWRREGQRLVEHWEADRLPADVAGRLATLLERLGLEYGAIVVIRTPEGRHVFLEVNPIGEYFWLEKWPGHPISDAIAELLLARSRSGSP